MLKLRTYQFKKILQKEQCEAVIGCTGDLFDPPAAFLASKELGIPFILYTFDFYSRQWTHPVLREFSEKHEKKIVTHAAQIIVANECMREEYQKRYGVPTTVIHNPSDLAEYEKNVQGIDLKKPGTPIIVYTGAVYEAHFSAFHNLISAIEKTGIPSLKLHVYTPQSPSYLKRNDITGPVEIHEHRPNSEMPTIQREADILFLPLAFNSPFPEIIKTSAPGKIGEYLASKRPILVHAPKNSFISWYFKKYECGLVVDEDNPTKLAQGIEHLLTDTRLQKILTDNAYERAHVDFSVTNTQRIFNKLIHRTITG